MLMSAVGKMTTKITKILHEVAPQQRGLGKPTEILSCWISPKRISAQKIHKKLLHTYDFMQIYYKQLNKCIQTQITCKCEYSRLARIHKIQQASVLTLLKHKFTCNQDCVVTPPCSVYETKYTETFQKCRLRKLHKELYSQSLNTAYTITI